MCAMYWRSDLVIKNITPDMQLTTLEEAESNKVFKIVIEYASNGSLSSIIKFEHQSLSSPQWNKTKKLINILGIASPMSYHHSSNIIQGDL